MVPHVVTKVPVLSNFWMRLLPASATKTFPLASTATPSGALNCPSPLPGLPHFVTKEPVFVQFCMRSVPEPAAQTLPLGATARQLRALDPLPDVVMHVQVVPLPG